MCLTSQRAPVILLSHNEMTSVIKTIRVQISLNKWDWGLSLRCQKSPSTEGSIAYAWVRECDFCACAIQDLSELTMEEPENKYLLTVKRGWRNRETKSAQSSFHQTWKDLLLLCLVVMHSATRVSTLADAAKYEWRLECNWKQGPSHVETGRAII